MNPESRFKIIWDFLCLIAIIQQSILIPFKLAFEVQSNSFYNGVEVFVDTIFVVDILISLNTGFYKKGYLVMKRKDIIKNYLRT